MRLTKYQHACFTLEKDGQVLVVDPGGFSTDFIAPENVAAVVVTHEHADHLDLEHLAAILAKNDEVLVLGPAGAISHVGIENKQVVEAGQSITVGPFDLEFFGGTHALIHEDIPRVDNLGVMINDLVYYPGDSLELPSVPVDTLALPATAPWSKIGEVIDFLTAVRPRFAFPTHDAIASEAGKQIIDKLLASSAEKNSIEYQRLTAPVEL